MREKNYPFHQTRTHRVRLTLYLSILLLPAGVYLSVGGKIFARHEQVSRQYEELRGKVRESGILPVIVRVRAPYRPESELATETERRAQRLLLDQARGALLKELVGYDPVSVKQFKYLPFLALRVNEAGLESLRVSSQALDIQEDQMARPALSESVPLIGAPAAWASGYTGAGQTVAILDSGVDKLHSMLAGKVVSEGCYSTNAAEVSVSSLCPAGATSSLAENSALPCNLSGVGCDHGTMVAGIAAGKDANFSGVAREANVIAIQIYSRLDNPTSCAGGKASCLISFDSDRINALERVYELRNTYSIAAVNLSLGGGSYTSNCDAANPSMKAAIDLLRGAGIATVVAAGNGYLADALSSPACISTAISVGSTRDAGTQVDQVSAFSNSAAFLTLLAPGELIASSAPGGEYAIKSGTSMAAPHVTGAWAIAKQKVPTATVAEIQTALVSTGLQVVDQRNGLRKPRLKIDAALAMLGNGEPERPSPHAPTNLQATALGTSLIKLTWTDNANDETGFKIQRKVGANGVWTVIATVAPNTTTFENTGLLTGTTYYYLVSAFNEAGSLGNSNEAGATTDNGLPGAPASLIASALSTTQIKLGWIDNSANENGFSIRRKTGIDGTWSVIETIGPNSTSYLNVRLDPGVTYYYSVSAFNIWGESAPSNEASATTEDGKGGTTPPAPPSNLEASALPTKFMPKIVALTWNDNSTNETGFRIRRKTGLNGAWEEVTTLGANVTELINVGLTRGETYYYNVAAFNAAGETRSARDVRVTAPIENFLALTNAQPSGDAIVRNELRYYRIYVPAGATQLTVQVEATGTRRGDVDLYVSHDIQPTLAVYDCISVTNTSNERCHFSNPAPGDWHILVRGYARQTSPFAVTATYQMGPGYNLPFEPARTPVITVPQTRQSAKARKEEEDDDDESKKLH